MKTPAAVETRQERWNWSISTQTIPYRSLSFNRASVREAPAFRRISPSSWAISRYLKQHCCTPNTASPCFRFMVSGTIAALVRLIAERWPAAIHECQVVFGRRQPICYKYENGGHQG